MFRTGVVLFYVKEYSNSELAKITKVLSDNLASLDISDTLVSESNSLNIIASSLPVGTIICKDISSNSEITRICLPMFSSHLSMPLKVDECVWFFMYSDRKSNTLNTIENVPCLTIKNYWVSRKIGVKISEDPNFCFFHRDTLINNDSFDRIEKIDQQIKNEKNNSRKKELKQIKSAEIKKIRLPDYSSSEVLENLYKDNVKPELLQDESLIKNRESKESFYFRATPRWYSKSHELSLQGSNNTLINLTVSENNKVLKDRGVIDIVAGRHHIRDYVTDDDSNSVILPDRTVQNFPESFDQVIRKDSYTKVKNITSNKEETLKDFNYYLNLKSQEENKNFENIEKKEGNISLSNDASRVYISESEEFLDDGQFYDTQYLNLHNVLKESGFNRNALSKEIKLDDLEYMKSFSLNNLESVFINPTRPLIDGEFQAEDDKNNPRPTVFIKTNDVRVVARKEYAVHEKETKLLAGSIRLIKEDENFEKYSHLCLENDGQVLVDGSSILLGNFNRELIRQDKDISQSSEMHGKGNSLLIGYDEEISEPLVLGETLKNMISELIQINYAVLDELKKVATELQFHTHPGVTPGPSVTATTLPTTVLKSQNFTDREHTNIGDHYNNLEQSLNKILSRFAKTS